MNPMDMMQIAGRLGTFNQQHPKFGAFLKAVAAKGLTEGTVMDVKFTATDGQEYVANIRMTAEDIETINMIREMGRKN
jgi:hypothetical protein